MNKQRRELRELLQQLLFAFLFIILNIVGVVIIFKDQLF